MSPLGTGPVDQNDVADMVWNLCSYIFAGSQGDAPLGSKCQNGTIAQEGESRKPSGVLQDRFCETPDAVADVGVQMLMDRVGLNSGVSWQMLVDR